MNTAKKGNLRITILFIISSFIIAHLCCWLLPGLFEAWNAQTVDRLFRFRSSVEYFRPPYDDTIIHVDLNNTSIQELKNFYLNRSHHARLINNLSAMGVSAQLYDFIFAAPTDENYDRRLREATINAGNVYFGCAFSLSKGLPSELPDSSQPQRIPYLESTKWNLPVEGDIAEWFTGTEALITFPYLATASQGLGYLNLTPDTDGFFRRLPLLIRYQDGFYPSFSLRAICDYLKVPPDHISVTSKALILKGAKLPGESNADDIVIPLDQNGTMVINYTGPWERMKHYNFVDVLRAAEDEDELALWKEELAGTIAVISEVATGTADIGSVPTDTLFPLSAVHANAMHTILTKSFLRELTGREMVMIEVTLLLCVLFLSLCFTSLYFSLSTLLLALLYLGCAGTAFLYGNTILHIIRPLLMVACALTFILVYRYVREEKEKLEGLRQRDFIRATFGRYLSNEVVEELIDSPDGLKMRGELREVTFLVSDLRGFTPLSASLSPHQIITILNRYLEAMVDIIARHRGTVDELQGDGILVFFGAPLVAHDDPERAIACAIEMQNKMLEINTWQTNHNLPELAMGIGINTGEVVVGNIGSERRSKYCAVGTAINTAYRIESYTTGGQILISSDTYRKVQQLILPQGTTEVHFKGIDHPITLYDIAGIKGNYTIALTANDAHQRIALTTPLPVKCFVVEGKTVSQNGVAGYLTHVGVSSAHISLDAIIPNHANLKLCLQTEKEPVLADIYAKLFINQTGSTESSIGGLLTFTFLPDDVKTFIENLLRENTGSPAE